MEPVTGIADKAGLLGSIAGAMGCSACFPALASLGATIGLGFLTRWEGLFIGTLIPIFALLALAANAAGWARHRRALRGACSVIGPILVLLAALLMRYRGVRTEPLMITGLVWMLVVSVWDLAAPAGRRCASVSRRPVKKGTPAAEPR